MRHTALLLLQESLGFFLGFWYLILAIAQNCTIDSFRLIRHRLIQRLKQPR